MNDAVQALFNLEGRQTDPRRRKAEKKDSEAAAGLLRRRGISGNYL